jgi:predicted secreted protein
VAVIECTLNQNVRDCGAACSPAMNVELVQRCIAHAVGMLQIRCPEQAALGLERRRRLHVTLRQAMEGPAARACCLRIAEDLVQRLQDHVHQGHRILAIVGGNELSPGCAVHHGSGGIDPSSGILVQEIARGLERAGLDVPIMALRDADPALHQNDLARLESLFAEHRTPG